MVIHYIMLGLQKFLIPSTSKYLLWTGWETIIPYKDGKDMSINCFTRASDNMQSKLIDKQGSKSITEEVKIRKLRNNISDIIKKSVTPHLTDDM